MVTMVEGEEPPSCEVHMVDIDSMGKPATIVYRDGTEYPPDMAGYFCLLESTGWNKEYHLTPYELSAALASSWRVVHAYWDGQLVGTG